VDRERLGLLADAKLAAAGDADVLDPLGLPTRATR